MKETEDDLIMKTVELGNAIRRHRAQGNLQSLPPPTISGYLALLRMARKVPHLSLQEIAQATLLGNASMDDRKYVSTVLNEVFGLQTVDEDDPTMGGHLF
ncbi:MAG: hypothetical protein SWQ30_12715 [Thermodesulfobacteriota bacterium]|nr:hypothetical protein [Thermodesulfobacteriota bacterium]